MTDEFAEMRKVASQIRQARQFRLPQEDIDYLVDKLDRMKLSHYKMTALQNEYEMRRAGY